AAACAAPPPFPPPGPLVPFAPFGPPPGITGSPGGIGADETGVPPWVPAGCEDIPAPSAAASVADVLPARSDLAIPHRPAADWPPVLVEGGVSVWAAVVTAGVVVLVEAASAPVTLEMSGATVPVTGASAPVRLVVSGATALVRGVSVPVT